MPGAFFYTVCVACAGGIFIRSFFNIGYTGIACAALVGLTLIGLWYRNAYLLKTRNYYSPFFFVGLVFVFVSLGILRFHVTDIAASSLGEEVGKHVELSGFIAREPDVRETTVHLYIKTNDTHDLVLATTDRYHEFSYGDRVDVSGALELPQSFETDLGRTFNYPGYLKARGVRYTVSRAEVEVTGSGAGNALLTGLLRTKKKFTNVIEGIIPEPAVGLGEGLLLGMKRALGQNLEDAFRRVGVIHIVVLSGYNVMLVAEAIMRLLSYFFGVRTRTVLGVAAISAFALLVGLSATVMRASIMAVLVLIARATGRTYTILRALMLAGILMLLINPYLITFDPGFQLSFLATLGLIFLAPALAARFKLVPTKFQIREYVTATVATQIFVFPLLLYLMGNISVVAVLVNVLVLPAVPPAMLLTFLTGIGVVLGNTAASVFGFGAYLVLSYITFIAQTFSKLPFASLDITFFPFWLLAFCYGVLGFVIYKLHTKKVLTAGPEAQLTATAGVSSLNLSEWTIEEENETADRADVRSAGSFPFR
jgi:competence protein ComEC